MKTLILLSMFAAELPPQAPPIDTRFDKIESRLDRIESKLGLTANCPCPAGPCICDDDCDCPDCPKHGKVGKLTYTGKGREVLLFTADWCQPCQAAKERLGGLLDRLVIEDCTEENEIAKRYGITQLPYLLSLNDGKWDSGVKGDFVTRSTANKWLDGPLRAPPKTAKNKATNVISSNLGYTPGHTHTCRSCGTSWSHANEGVTDPRAHNCPSCGQYETGNRTEGWTRSQPRRSAPVVRFSQGGFWQRQCSGGQCRNVWVSR